MSVAGDPQLPVEVLTIGIPWGSRVAAKLVDPVYDDEADVLVAPCPAYMIDDEQQTTASFVPDKAAYGQNRFLPAEPVVVDRPFTLRQQRISSIEVAPFLYNPSTRVLRRLLKGRLEITLVADGTGGIESGNSAVPKSADPWFEDVYKSLLWNYEEAKGWRGVTPAQAKSDPTRDWFIPGEKYHRVPVAVDGWYRLTSQDLSTVGALPGDLSTLQMFHRGTEIPLRVRVDSSIEFYGRRNYGDSTYHDFYSDTSAFWLTFGNREGLRYLSPEPALP